RTGADIALSLTERDAVAPVASSAVVAQRAPAETGRISGTVTDTDGDPVEDVEVVAGGDYSLSTWTASDGSYTLEVNPGQYRVEFWPSSYHLAQYWNGEYDWAKASVLEVSAGDDLMGIDAV